MSQNNIEQQ